MCDGCNFSRTRQIDILGKKVMVKNYICSLNGEPYREKPDDKQVVFTKSYRDFDSCRCRDGVYSSKKGGIEEFYGRQTMPGNPGYVRTLVYGADNHLRTGYLGEVIA